MCLMLFTLVFRDVSLDLMSATDAFSKALLSIFEDGDERDVLSDDLTPAAHASLIQNNGSNMSQTISELQSNDNCVLTVPIDSCNLNQRLAKSYIIN